jgi:hypothetical protein
MKISYLLHELLSMYDECGNIDVVSFSNNNEQITSIDTVEYDDDGTIILRGETHG